MPYEVLLPTVPPATLVRVAQRVLQKRRQLLAEVSTKELVHVLAAQRPSLVTPTSVTRIARPSSALLVGVSATEALSLFTCRCQVLLSCPETRGRTGWALSTALSRRTTSPRARVRVSLLCRILSIRQ